MQGSAPDYFALGLPAINAGPWRMQMGLMALKPDDWIEIDDAYGEQLALKRRLLAESPGDVFRETDGAEPASQEVLETLARHLARRFPERFSLSGDGNRIDNRVTGETWDLRGGALRPLDTAGRLVQEDLCLMLPGDGGEYVLGAASLCFPTRWRLAEKIGRPMGAIHDPVPGYGEALARPVNRFLAALKVERPVWRINWSLTDDAALFQPARKKDFGKSLWLRLERQTLRRLERTGAVLFTIRIHQRPIEDAVPGQREADKLRGLIATMPDAMRDYKCLNALGAMIDRHLAGFGAGAG